MSPFRSGNQQGINIFRQAALLRREGIRDSPAYSFDILRRLPSLPEPHVVTIKVLHLVMEFLANALLDNSTHLATGVPIFFLI